jgi:hypothetical protein
MAHPLALSAQKAVTPEAMPKLVIGIAVDQLRTDYLYALQSRFGEDGFRRLLSEGVVYESVTFDLDQPDATATLAVLASGSYPFVSGICATRAYNPQTLREQSIFYDKKYLGNFTQDNYSPAALIGTTVGDELKTATNGAAKVYSIAPEAEAALLGAGHRGNAAFWIDNKSGKWASTTYYKDFPHFVERFNRSEAPTNLEQLHWLPLNEGETTQLDILPYKYTPTGKFDHQFLRFRQPYYPYYKTSGLVNEAVTKLCKVFLENGNLGRGEVPDLLQITYYAGTYQQGVVEQNAWELQDTYLRLDRCLADLMQSIDATVGLKNTLIYLTSTGDTNPNRTNVEGLSTGEFNANRCSALLNAYLMSIYGQGSWVVGMNGSEIFLNHKTIEDKKVALYDIEKDAAEFVALFSGVQEVVTAQQLLHEDYNARVTRQRNGYHKSTSGDLLVTLQPGWALKVDDVTPARSQTRHDVAPGPAIFYAPRLLTAQHIATPIEAVTLAPTVSALIRIRAPSGCTALPLPLLHRK